MLCINYFSSFFRKFLLVLEKQEITDLMTDETIYIDVLFSFWVMEFKYLSQELFPVLKVLRKILYYLSYEKQLTFDI